MVLDAIERALAERKITPYIKFTYRIDRLSKEEALATARKRERRSSK